MPVNFFPIALVNGVPELYIVRIQISFHRWMGAEKKVFSYVQLVVCNIQIFKNGIHNSCLIYHELIVFPVKLIRKMKNKVILKKLIQNFNKQSKIFFNLLSLGLLYVSSKSPKIFLQEKICFQQIIYEDTHQFFCTLIF